MIFEKKFKVKILRTIKRITTNIENSDFETLGLYRGLSGQLLFLFEAFKYDSTLIEQKVFVEKFAKLQDLVSFVNQNHCLSTGTLGVCWLLEYVGQRNIEGYDARFLTFADQHFLDNLTKMETDESLEIELVLGLVGYLVYANRRHKYCDQTPLFRAIIKIYDRLAETQNNNLYWNQPKNSIFNKTHSIHEVNLGMAHGVTGIIAGLISATQAPSVSEKSKYMVRSASLFLLSNKNKLNNSISLFPSIVGIERESRLGWCYGDLSIALTLMRSGRCTGDINLYNSGLEIAKKTLIRKLGTSSVTDHGLCHGTSGICILYLAIRNLCKIRSDQILFEAALRYWLSILLQEYDEDFMNSWENLNSVKPLGLLEGESGIGLALVSILRNDIRWADCLLIS